MLGLLDFSLDGKYPYPKRQPRSHSRRARAGCGHGSGGFIHFLLDSLKDYVEIIGVDNNERAAAAFAEAFRENSKIHFQMMDAAQPFSRN